MVKHYQYVGPKHLEDLADSESLRQHIQTQEDFHKWFKESKQAWNAQDELTVTFIVDVEHQLWIADRHSEHIACARGKPVLSAGEMTFIREKDEIEILRITNQSTGYCPEPASWKHVEQALRSIDFYAPSDFEVSFIFRKCHKCDVINIVKEELFECAVCQRALNAEWNFA